MNIFDSFQPKKQRLGTEAAAKPKQNEPTKAFRPTAPPPISGLKALLLNLDSNPLTLSVSHKDLSNDPESAADKALKAKLAHIPVRAVKMMRWSDISTHNLTLYKQITIEANFDLIQLVDSHSIIRNASCYIYPHNPRQVSDNYSLSDFVNRNLGKTRHWTIQRSDLPYFNTSILSNIAATSSAGAALMLGGPGGSLASTGTRAGPADHEAALLSVQSRMLQWQEALFALLRDYLASVSCNGETNHTSSNTIESKVFYVLGRSLLVPANAASSAASSNGKIVSLPYTSAVFYYLHRTSTTSAANYNNNKSQSPSNITAPTMEPEIEPACLLIGVHKSTLNRLQQLGAVCTLIEDLAHPWTHTSNNNNKSNVGSATQGVTAGASAEINVAASRGTLDPHASTSALLNNKKIGINILLTGQFSVRVAAEVLLESVFAFVHQGGRPASTDVPILMSHNKFAHSMEMNWDKRPIQCDYKFTRSTTDKSNVLPSQEGKANKDASIRIGYHKVQLQGLITSRALPLVMERLHQLARSHIDTLSTTTTNNNYTTTQRKLTISSAYSYLKHGESHNEKNNAAHTDMRNLPGAVAAPVVSLQARHAPPLPPVNPMVLVTTKARVYAAPKEEAGSGSEKDDESDDSSEDEKNATTDIVRGESKDQKDASGDGEENIVKSDIVSSKRKLGQVQTEVVSTPRSNIPTADTAATNSLSATVNVPTSTITTSATSTGSSTGELRAEKWLKQRRDSSVPYFLLQLSTVAPRCTQLSYAHLAARQSSAEIGAEDLTFSTENDDFVLLAEPLIEEIRWQGDMPGPGDANHSSENVEVVTTTQPTLRTRVIEPAKSKGSVGKASSLGHDHVDELEENGVLLDALNKYSIFVESKPM